MAVTWTDDHTFILDGVTFSSMQGGGDLTALKPRPFVDFYETLVADLQPRRILELGIYRGGSLGMMALLARPERLVGVDLIDECLPLDRWLAGHDLPVEAFYGVDQSDTVALEKIVSTFDGPLDLIVDDASHLTDPTRASFNYLFPHLRDGGVYVIEDWRPHLVGLVADVVRASSHLVRAIARVETAPDFVVIHRGYGADLTPGRFDIRNHLH